MFRNRVFKVTAVVVVGTCLLGGGYLLGFEAGKKQPEIITVKGLTNLTEEEPGNVNFELFWQAWKTISDNYLRNSDISNQDKVYGSVSGLVESLNDPYSVFLKPSDNQKFQQDVEGSFGGIGAELGIKNNQVVVVAPLKDTPASRAGLTAGDEIIAINSSSTESMSIDDAVSLIRGPVGTEVTLSILRNGWDKPKDFKITRAMITIPTLDLTMKGDVAWIQLYSFNANASFMFYRAMVEAVTEGAKGLVLDLRNDPGGYLEVAVDLAGWFLPRGSLVVSEVGKASPQEFRAQGNAALVSFPTVVLINRGSASASEILAGTLRDVRHIKLIGEKSFGKGTVQQLMPLGDGSSIKLTIAHWVLPSGQILEEGLNPNIEVKITDEDIVSKRDPQLDKAIEVLKTEISKVFD